MELFEDRENGAFFSTPVLGPDQRPDLVLRLKDDYDGAEPSGNSAMAMALLRLARITGREDFRASAERTLRAFASRMKTAGAGVPQMLVALAFAVARPMEIVLARHDDSRAVDLRRDDPAVLEMLRTIHRHFLPSAVVIMATEAALPMPPVDGLATAYVCENYACKQPVTDVAALERELAGGS
jgi:hypothetical protein